MATMMMMTCYCPTPTTSATTDRHQRLAERGHPALGETSTIPAAGVDRRTSTSATTTTTVWSTLPPVQPSPSECQVDPARRTPARGSWCLGRWTLSLEGQFRRHLRQCQQDHPIIIHFIIVNIIVCILTCRRSDLGWGWPRPRWRDFTSSIINSYSSRPDLIITSALPSFLPDFPSHPPPGLPHFNPRSTLSRRFWASPSLHRDPIVSSMHGGAKSGIWRICI